MVFWLAVNLGCLRFYLRVFMVVCGQLSFVICVSFVVGFALVGFVGLLLLLLIVLIAVIGQSFTLFSSAGLLACC